MTALLLIFACFWIICGAFAYAITLAFFQRRFPTLAEEEYAVDVLRAISAGILGVAGLGAALFVSEGARDGLKWK